MAACRPPAALQLSGEARPGTGRRGATGPHMKRDRSRSPLTLGQDPSLRADAAWREATRDARAAAVPLEPAPRPLPFRAPERTSAAQSRPPLDPAPETADGAADGEDDRFDAEDFDFEAEAARAAPVSTHPQAAAAPRRRASVPRRTAPAAAGDGLARAAYPLAALAALAWAGGFGALVYLSAGGRAPTATPAVAAATGMVAVLPVLFIGLFAHALRQGARLAAEARAARALSDDLVAPAALAAVQAGGVVEAVRAEIDRAAAAADDALSRLSALGEAVAREGRRVQDAADAADQAARTVGERMEAERAGLAALSGRLELQSADLADAAERQVRRMAEVSETAGAQVREAGAALAARAVDLAAAAEAADRAAAAAGAGLSRGMEQVDAAGGRVAGTLDRLGAELAGERDRLAGLAEALRADQDDAEVRAETLRARTLADTQAARAGAEAADAAAAETVETLRRLISETETHVRDLAETARVEHQAVDGHARAALATYVEHAAAERAALEEQTRGALDGFAQAADAARGAVAGRLEALRGQAAELGDLVRGRMDDLAQASFDAGRQADQAFDARTTAARRAVEEVAGAMEAAGAHARERLESGLEDARSAMAGLGALVAEVDERMAALPEEARQRADALRRAVEAGMEALTAAARRAAEETQAVDAAFQDRVRRNYATLGEAVRLMSAMAETAEAARRAPPAAPVLPTPAPASPAVSLEPPRPEPPRLEPAPSARPVTATRLAAAAWAEARQAAPASAAAGPPVQAPSPPEPRAAEVAAFAPAATGAAASEPLLRPRLKLAPTEEDEAMRRLFDPPSAPAPSPAAGRAAEPEKDGWSWRDLLSTVDDEPVDEEGLGERLAAEVAAMGVDADALLPAGRADELAEAWKRGGAAGAAELVRRMAPAAVRRLSRRAAADRVLGAQIDHYLRRAGARAGEAARRPDAEAALRALFSQPAGRTHLLLAAAADAR